jgi:hypothetical protein
MNGKLPLTLQATTSAFGTGSILAVVVTLTFFQVGADFHRKDHIILYKKFSIV